MSFAEQWEVELEKRLPLFGHRNWIVVADAAYPAQSNPGIETIVTKADQLQVLCKVAEKIAASTHICANIYTDAELDHVAEMDAPGVVDYREKLRAMLHGKHIQQIEHEQIIHKLDAGASLFRVLILKTRMTIPYTSVFFELDCGYWSAETEARMRAAMGA
jgi:L-fucose mutarotase/ribose pyranase (RbsD/FucU family)